MEKNYLYKVYIERGILFIYKMIQNKILINVIIIFSDFFNKSVEKNIYYFVIIKNTHKCIQIEFHAKNHLLYFFIKNIHI